MSEALTHIEAFVLAGGFGTRLHQTVPNRQKVIAPIAGRPALARLLDRLAEAGIRRTVIGVGHLAGQVREALGSAHGPMRLDYSEESEPLGTGGALRHAVGMLQSDPVLALNGDSFVDVNLAAFLAWHRARRAVASVLLTTVADPSRYGAAETDDRGRILTFREKAFATATPGADLGAVVNAGVYLLNRPVVAGLPARVPLSLEWEVLPSLIGAGLYGWRGGGRLIDIGTPDGYTAAQHFFQGADVQPAGRPLRPFVVLDRDGTLMVERHYLSDPQGVELLPGVIEGLSAMRAAGLGLVVATNQAGVGREYFPESRVAQVHARLAELLAAQGVRLDGIVYCPHHPDAGCGCRKPATGLVRQAVAALGTGAKPVAVVGDKRCDVDLARALGVPSVLVTTGYGAGELAAGAAPDFVVDSVAEAAAVLGPSGPAPVPSS
jgi:histidinol-phosphate phosphatase family protein